MTAGKWITAALVVGLLGSCVYLLRINRGLQQALARADVASEVAAPTERNCRPALAAGAARIARPLRLSARSDVQSGPDSPTREPALITEPPATGLARLTRAERAVTAALSRGQDETAEDYHERVAPQVEAFLAAPREQLAVTREQLEDAAGVTPEQRDQVDATLADAYDEALALAAAAIARGELAPDRSWSGVLSFGGGLGAIADSAQDQIAAILTPAQREQFSTDHFDWATYIAVNAPWEQVEAAPPLPDERAN